MCFVQSDSHVEVTDNPYEIKDIGCISLYFTFSWNDIEHIPDASQLNHVVPKRDQIKIRITEANPYCSGCLIFARWTKASTNVDSSTSLLNYSQSAVNDVILYEAANIFCEIIEKLTIYNRKLVLFLYGNAAIVILACIHVIRIR